MKKKIIILMALIVFAATITGCSRGTDTNTKAVSQLNEAEGVIEILLDSITNKLQKFDYDANGIIVTYFAVRGSDGKVRTAFDACDVCGGYKGYRQEGNDITCNNCGRVFYIDGLGTKNKGYGCWPSYLGREIKDGAVIIKTAELEQGAFRFA